MIVYKKLIYPFTYTRKFTRHPTTKFQKVSSLFKPKNQRHYARTEQKIISPLLIQRKNRAPLCAGKQKRPTNPHTTKRGVQSASRLVRIVHVCIGLCFFCMYFNSTASWVLYLNTAIFICPARMKKYFSLSTVEQFLIREKQTPPVSPMAPSLTFIIKCDIIYV